MGNASRPGYSRRDMYADLYSQLRLQALQQRLLEQSACCKPTDRGARQQCI